MDGLYVSHEAGKVLSDVEPSKVFVLKNGGTIKNLSDFYNALLNMDEEIFSHHANHEKNDFGNWIRDVHGDYILANSLFQSKSREEFISVVGERIYDLKKSIEESVGFSQKECSSSSVSQAETAAERLEKILSDAITAKHILPKSEKSQKQNIEKEDLKSEISSNTKNEISSDAKSELFSFAFSNSDNLEKSQFYPVLLPLFKDKSESTISELASLFSIKSLKHISADIKSVFTLKKTEKVFVSESTRDDTKKSEIISYLKKVHI